MNPSRKMTLGWPLLASMALALCCILTISSTPAQGTPMEEHMRSLWARNDTIRGWLVCGPFPTQSPHDANTDFLIDHRGEIGINPHEGMAHRLPNGDSVAWKRYSSRVHDLVFIDALALDEPQFVCAYAFAALPQETERDAVLSFYSGARIKIWLNGKLVTAPACWEDTPDIETLLPISLNPGENRLLIKCEHRDGDPDDWAFRLAILSVEQARLRDEAAFEPSIISGPKQNLVVLTDRTKGRLSDLPGRVELQVVAPGGAIIARQTVPRGERVEFLSSQWEDGPYEVIGTLFRPDGKIARSYPLWYKGDARKAITELVESARTADDSTSTGMVHKILAQRVTYELDGDPSEVSSDRLQRVYDQLVEFEQVKQRSAGGRGGERPHGMVRLAYRDEVDDSAQFCVVFFPPNYDPSKQWPTVIDLHGRHGGNPPYHRWPWSHWDIHSSLADETGVIAVCPFGRGDHSYRGLGMEDVLRCIEMAKTQFPVDEDRLYLTGFSMGGYGSWHVGSRYPQLFAAVGVMSGGSDYHAKMTGEQIENMTPKERFRHERRSTFAQAEQLLTTPLVAIHGELDSAVPVAGGRYGINLLQRWGYDVRYHELPGAGHVATVPYRNDIVSQLRQHRREANPPRVRVRAADLKTAAAHWLRIEQREDPWAFMEAYAQVVGSNIVELDTENALEITLSPSASLIDPTQPLEIIWNGSDVRRTRLDADGKITLRTPTYDPAGIIKTPPLAGPIDDFETLPFAIVIGTIASDPDMREACRREGDRLAAEWEKMAHHKPRLFDDSEISDSQIREYSLLLIGGPEHNSVCARLAERIPLHISSTGITIDGHEFPAINGAVRMIYPHPLNSARYVLVVASTSPSAMQAAERIPDDIDFGIAEINESMQTEPILGYFDHRWRLDLDYISCPQDAAR